MTSPLKPIDHADFVLLRHGETQWNREGRYQGQHDSPLTLEGIGQIRAISETLRESLGDMKGYRLYASPLSRTRQSISVFCEQLGLDYRAVQFDKRLMERCYGRWEGHTLAEIADRYPQDIDEERLYRWSFAIPEGGESFTQVEDRLRSFLQDTPNDRPMIIMSHGGAGRVLRGLCTGLSPQQIFSDSSLQSTAFRISQNTAHHIEASFAHLQAFGCNDKGLGLRI